MAWGVSLNPPHMLLLLRCAVAWGTYLAFGLVLGACYGIRPRADEFVFVAALPLAVLIPYALACLAGAALKVWLWPVGRRHWHRRGPRFVAGLRAKGRIGQRSA
jgi:hypothetical protein